MGSQSPNDERRIDRDGVTHIQKKRSGGGMWIVGLALGFTVVCLILSAWLVSSPDPVPVSEPPPPVKLAEHVPSPTPVAAPRPARPIPTPAAPQPAPEEAPAPQEPAPSAPAEGINLFRPGTKPLKQGIIVPEDFPLPPGYVRHYQSTDNGEQVKPILMFHPDYKPVDSNGQPVELPANRVVPPEMAPRGMPIEILEVPEGPEGVEPIP